MIDRQKLLYVYMAFLVIWFTFLFLTVRFIGVSVVEALGLGTATGIFLGAFKDMWQFVWRKGVQEK